MLAEKLGANQLDLEKKLEDTREELKIAKDDRVYWFNKTERRDNKIKRIEEERDKVHE